LGRIFQLKWAPSCVLMRRVVGNPNCGWNRVGGQRAVKGGARPRRASKSRQRGGRDISRVDTLGQEEKGSRIGGEGKNERGDKAVEKRRYE